MSDKKITQLSEHVVPVQGVDLLPLVANTATQPTNYKVQVKNFLSQIEIGLPQTTFSALKISGFVTANAVAAVLAAGELALVANSSVSVTVKDRHGLIVRNLIQNGNSNVTGQFSVATFVLDTGNSNTDIANTYGVIINHTLDTGVAAARLRAPRAYVGFLEDGGTGPKTAYLFDIGAQGKTVSGNTSTANNSAVFGTKGSAAASHVLKVNINGTDMWLLASNVAPV